MSNIIRRRVRPTVRELIAGRSLQNRGATSQVEQITRGQSVQGAKPSVVNQPRRSSGGGGGSRGGGSPVANNQPMATPSLSPPTPTATPSPQPTVQVTAQDLIKRQSQVQRGQSGFISGFQSKQNAITTVKTRYSQKPEPKYLRFGNVIDYGLDRLDTGAYKLQTGIEKVTGRKFKRGGMYDYKLFSRGNFYAVATGGVTAPAFYSGRMAISQQGGKAISSLGTPLTSVKPKPSKTIFVQRTTTQGDITRAETGAVTTIKGRFTNKKVYSGAISETITDDALFFKSKTAGISREVKGYDILRGKEVIGKGKPFASVGVGKITQQGDDITLFQGVQKSQLAGNKPKFDVFGGATKNINDKTLIVGASKQLTTKGKPIGKRSTFFGVSNKQEARLMQESGTLALRTKGGSSVGEILNKNIINKNIVALTKPKVANPMQPRTAPTILKQQSKTSEVFIRPQTQRQEQKLKQTPINFTPMGNIENNIAKEETKQIAIVKQRQGSGTAFKQPQAQPQAEIQRTPQITIQKTPQIPRLKTPTMPTPLRFKDNFVPFAPAPFAAYYKFPQEQTKKERNPFKNKRKNLYFPDYAAVVLKIRKKLPKRAASKVYTGIRPKPIPIFK